MVALACLLTESMGDTFIRRLLTTKLTQQFGNALLDLSGSAVANLLVSRSKAVTLQPSTLTRWALSLHLCSQSMKDVLMTEDSQKDKITHKEKMPHWIRADNEGVPNSGQELR